MHNLQTCVMPQTLKLQEVLIYHVYLLHIKENIFWQHIPLHQSIFRDSHKPWLLILFIFLIHFEE